MMEGRYVLLLRRSRSVLLVLLTILSSLIVGYGLALISRSNFSPALADTITLVDTAAPARRTAVLAASEEDEPTATATPEPNAASTTIAAMPAPTPIPAARLERFVSDSFDAPDGTWLVRTTEQARAEYIEGQYQLALNGQPELGVSSPLEAERYQISADVAVESGSAGLIFLAAKPATFYRFMIRNDGSYAVQATQPNSA